MPRVEGETYFNNFTQTGHEEMRDWTPRYYQAIKEADANMGFAGQTIDLMAESLEKWCRNQFIATMDDEALSRMEAFYYITDTDGKTMDARKRYLQAKQLGAGKINTDRVARIVQSYVDATPTFEFIHRLVIHIEVGEDLAIYDKEMREALRAQLPAHIAFVLDYGTPITIDESDVEKISASITHALKIAMWPLEPILDGTWLLDGERRLTTTGGYHPAVSVANGTRIFTAEDIAEGDVKLGFEARVEHGMGLVMGHRLSLKEDPGETARNIVHSQLAETEEIGAVAVVAQNADCWFLDATKALTDSRKLNAIYEKEEL